MQFRALVIAWIASRKSLRDCNFFPTEQIELRQYPATLLLFRAPQIQFQLTVNTVDEDLRLKCRSLSVYCITGLMPGNQQLS